MQKHCSFHMNMMEMSIKQPTKQPGNQLSETVTNFILFNLHANHIHSCCYNSFQQLFVLSRLPTFHHLTTITEDVNKWRQLLRQRLQVNTSTWQLEMKTTTRASCCWLSSSSKTRKKSKIFESKWKFRNMECYH